MHLAKQSQTHIFISLNNNTLRGDITDTILDCDKPKSFTIHIAER